jgi:glycosyltransferase involved in cell wall biosynthesis
MKNILWLTEWFPSSFEPFNGDGIERRGKAASLHHNIFVIYVKKKPGLGFGKIETEERTYNSHYKAFLYFYPSIRKFNRVLDLLLSNYYFLKLHCKAIRDFKKRYNKPDGIQVNVAMKNGVIALLCKWLWHIDFIVVEGWGLFLPESIPRFKDKNWLFRFFAHQVFKQAILLITVSNHLGKMIRANIAEVSYKVIPSVVDKTIFYPAQESLEHKVFRFIHISNLDYSKNIQQMLSGLKLFLASGYQAELIIHAPYSKMLSDEIALLKLGEHVIIKQEAPQPLLADSIRSADVLILFSLYETFGNVVIEAQACGVPVITSDYPTFFETIENEVNGIIAKGKDAGALAEAMINCIKDKYKFDSKRISEKAFSSYSFDLIGKMFDEVYTQYF